MKHYAILIFIFHFGVNNAFAQNLIPNPSFEDHRPQFQYIFHGDTSFQTTAINCWASPTYYGFRYCHYNSANNGPASNLVNSHPHSGNSWLLLEQTTYLAYANNDSLSDFRRYSQTKLLQPLIAGQTYELKLYIFVGYGIYGPITEVTHFQNFGAAFTSSRMANFTPGIGYLTWPHLDFSSQYFGLNDWQELSITFIADGTEKYLTIGNFDFNSELVLYNGTPPLNPNVAFVPPTIAIDDISQIPLGSTNTANPNANLGPDTVICGTSVNMTLIAASGFDQYLWNTGDTTQSIQITQPGTYSVNVNDECSLCNDTIVVSLQPFLNLDLGNDTLICVDNSFQLQLTPNHSNLYSYNWSSGQNTPSISINTAGTYILEANYACGTLRDTVVVNTQAKPNKPIFTDTSVCVNSGDFQPFAAGNNLLWFNDELTGTGSGTAPILSSSIIDTFNIWVSQTINTCESDRYKQTITVLDLPYFTLMDDTTLCEFNDVKFGPRESDWDYFWNDGYDKSPRIFENSGYFVLTTENDCGNYSQGIFVEIEECPCTMFFPEAITANGDGLNDFLTATYFCDLEYYELKVFNRWGQTVYTSKTPEDKWQIGNEFPQGVYQLSCIYKGKLTQEEMIIQKLVVIR